MNPRTLSGSRPPLAKITAKYGMKSAPTAGMPASHPRWLTNMRIAAMKQRVRMPIMIRYRFCRYLMSSDIGLRAWVTRWTCCPRPECPTLIPPRYRYLSRSATPEPGKGKTRSARLADRRHVERLHPQRRHRGAVEVVAPLARQRRLGRAHLEQPRQQRHR